MRDDDVVGAEPSATPRIDPPRLSTSSPRVACSWRLYFRPPGASAANGKKIATRTAPPARSARCVRAARARVRVRHECGREQHRVELRRRGGAEEGESPAGVAAHDERHRPGGERRGPEIEAVHRDRAEECGRGAGHDDRAVASARRRPREGERDGGDGGEPVDERGSLEPRHVGARGSAGRASGGIAPGGNSIEKPERYGRCPFAILVP